ncbi:voltage-gated potassium channel, partial [Aaosphaeria arxii CBS 175.79]
WISRHDPSSPRWWFASTAIPLLAATIGPLANVLSIAALVTYWRETIFIDGQFVSEFDGVTFADPPWCFWLNVASLILGFLGNLFLLLNFTQRIRYIIALPLTIILWYIATGLLIGIIASLHIYAPAVPPNEIYSQGFWYAVMAATCYLICSMILMVNMLGYFMGRYPDTFALTDAQRTLILQSMLFFIWLAGGAGVFMRIETDAGEQGWEYADALYFCDVTILTVGFGDLYPTTDVGRGIVFPYSVIGIVMLGLVISSIYKFMRQIGEENIINRHIERMRERTLELTVTNSIDLVEGNHGGTHRWGVGAARKRFGKTPKKIGKEGIGAPKEGRQFAPTVDATSKSSRMRNPNIPFPGLGKRKSKMLLLREEKDRFDAMRNIQESTAKFKKWWALSGAVTAFAILWCAGAVVFWRTEHDAQGMSYFQALYFCYISLLTIGYGDLAPKTNAGRCFFVVWSLIAVPTMTILVSNLGDTLVAKFKAWASRVADFTVLPQDGIWRSFIDNNPWLANCIQMRIVKKRVEHGFDVADPEEALPDDPAGHSITSPTIGNEDPEEAADMAATMTPTLPELAREANGPLPTQHALSRRLALEIRRVAADLRLGTPKRYEYEDWVEFTRLIRSSSRAQTEQKDGAGEDDEEDEEGLVEWDWIGHNSPLVSGMSESEFILQRLCESLVRVERRK